MEQLTANSVMDNFIFPNEIPIDAAHTLDQLTGRFRSVRDGLPELVKNSKDQYSRLQIDDPDERQILVISCTSSHDLAVLDFAGAPAENFAGWTNWSDPAAGQVQTASDIEAGHGNGGKAFMVRGAKSSAYLESCHQGKRTKKGFINDRPSERYKPGFAQIDGLEINDVEESSPQIRLSETLASLRLSFEQLPEKVQAIFRKRNSFTVALLRNVIDWEGRRKPKLKSLSGPNLVEVLATHGQTAMTIETCDVWVIRDGKIVGGQPIRPAEILPYPGFEEPIEIEIPDLLLDPDTEEMVRTQEAGEPKGALRLQTSQTQLQISASTRAKNVIRIWNERNNVAIWTPQDLHSVSASSFIFGELRCSALKKEHLDGATRQHLADTPLARALKEWAAGHVRELAEGLPQCNGREHYAKRSAASTQCSKQHKRPNERVPRSRGRRWRT